MRGFCVKAFSFLVLLLFLSCKKDPELITIHNLSGDRVMVFGHGGMGYRCSLPMDSKASLCECLQSEADGTEMDLQMSTDSVLFLYHDEDLSDATGCSGKISELSSLSVQGCKFKKDGKRHEVIRAETFFDDCGKDPDKLFTLECKLGSSDRGTFSRALVSLIQKYQLKDRCLIETVEPEFLRLLESADASLETYLYCKDPEIAINLRDTLAFDGLTISMDLVNASQVKAVHEKGLKVSVFSMVTKRQNIDGLLLSPDNIQTDNLKHLVEVYVKKRK
jgi:glycerophosphoryl diester phosphodiesterase